MSTAAPERTAARTISEGLPRQRARVRRRNAGRDRLTGGETLLLWLGFSLPGLAVAAAAVLSVGNRPLTEAPAPAPPRAEGAYTAFVRAGSLVVEKRGSVALTRKANAPTAPLAERKALLAANAPALEALRRTIDRPFVQPRNATLTPFRSLSRALTFEGALRRDSGDPAGASASLLDAIQIGVTLPRGSGTLGALTGAGCEAPANRLLWDLSGRLDAPTAAAAAQRLEALQARRTPFLETLRTEVATTHEALRAALATDSPRSLLRQMAQGDGTSGVPAGLLLRSALLTRQSVLDHYRAQSQDTLRRAALPWGAPGRATPYTGPNDVVNEYFQAMQEMGAYEATVRGAQTQSALLTARLALRTYRLRFGRYPESLEALVSARILRRVPLDGFTDDRPLRYRLTGGEPRLYSVGPDGRDDGGRPIERPAGSDSTLDERLSADARGDFGVPTGVKW